MKRLLLPLVVFVAGCSWFHKTPAPPEPTQLVVNGAPAGSVLYVDGAAAAKENEGDSRPQVVDVTPGMHVVEVKVGEHVGYREQTYVAPGEKHVVLVLTDNRGS
ncbi:MAG: hypothetical protein U1F35_01475 [Steroidobacteraceae bacterium]